MKVPSEAGSGEEGKLELPGIGPRVPGFGRGVMMGVYVQELMRLSGGVRNRVRVRACIRCAFTCSFNFNLLDVWCRARDCFFGGGERR